MKLSRFIFLVLLPLLLTACGPIYKTQYSYQPPQSDTGRMCAAQCVQSRGMCQQMCRAQNNNCEMQAQENAAYSYHAYVKAQQAAGKKIRKNIDDFDNSYMCNESCNCRSNFNLCYSTCGGKVTSRQICTAFCNKQ